MEEILQAGISAGCHDVELDLVDAAVSGDAQAFAALYDRHLERVYRHVYYWVGNRPDAEDLTQQVFLNAWRSIGTYQRTGASFVAWLLKIAHNLVVSSHRRTKEACQLEIDVVSRDRWGDPEAMALARYDSLAIRRAILRLKPEQQQVVVMRFVEHLEYADIAAALGKSEGNIRVIQHRALTELRRRLAYEVRP